MTAYDSLLLTSARPVDLEWGQLVLWLERVRQTPCNPCTPDPKHCQHKDGPMWSPVDCEVKRLDVNVRAITCAVIDLDHISEPDFLQVLDRLQGHELVIHSTHSHRAGDLCFRLVMPLTAPVLPQNWRAVHRTIVEQLQLPADPSCKDLSRAYFLPSKPIGSPWFFLHGQGQPLNTNTLLYYAAQLPTAPLPQPGPVSDLPLSDLQDLSPAISIDLLTLTERLKEVRYRKSRSHDSTDQERYTILDRILKGTPLALPGHASEAESKREKIPRGRDAAVNQAASLLAFCMPSGTPPEAALELLRPSVATMDFSEPDGQWKDIDFWMARAHFSYTRAMQRRRERDAQRELLDRAISERLGGLLPKPPMLDSAVPGDPLTDKPVDLSRIVTPEQLAAWRDLLIKKADGTVLPLGENAFTILAFSEETRRTIRFNEIEKTIEIHGGPFANTPPSVLGATVTDWLCRHHSLNFHITDVEHRIARVAHVNSYDPLAEYLYSLQWDGMDRVNDFLIRYAHATTLSLGGANIIDHIKRIGRRFLISAVARALNPGCKVDTVLVLEGEQGDRKSTMLEVLGGRWYCGDPLILGDKDSKILAAQNWIIEIPEMDAFIRSSNSEKKKFFSQRVDKLRLPYGKVPIPLLRRCIFVGTYNPGDGSIFTDITGNRRYHPAYCKDIDILGLIKDRDQVWAQAVHYYLCYKELDRQGIPKDENPYKWWLTKAEQTEAEDQTDERMSESVYLTKIAEWWADTPPRSRPQSFTNVWIAETVLRMPVDRITKAVQTSIGIALNQMKFKKHRPTVNGVQLWHYYPTEELMNMPLGTRASHLRLVANEVTRGLHHG